MFKKSAKQQYPLVANYKKIEKYNFKLAFTADKLVAANRESFFLNL